MIRFFKIIFLIFFSKFAYADFGFIDDRDGFVNLRQKPNLKSKIIGTLNNGEIILCNLEGENSKFCYVTLKNGDTGYIYKNRVNFFKGYNLLSYKKSASDKKIAIYYNANINIAIYAGSIDGDKKLYQQRNGLCFYKNKKVWGTDGDIPDNNFLYLKNIELKNKNYYVNLVLDKNDQLVFLKNFGEDSSLYNFLIYYKDDDIYVLNQLSDGAGMYNLALHFRKNILIEHRVWSDLI